MILKESLLSRSNLPFEKMNSPQCGLVALRSSETILMIHCFDTNRFDKFSQIGCKDYEFRQDRRGRRAVVVGCIR